jgi:hypothetical protein
LIGKIILRVFLGQIQFDWIGTEAGCMPYWAGINQDGSNHGIIHGDKVFGFHPCFLELEQEEHILAAFFVMESM